MVKRKRGLRALGIVLSAAMVLSLMPATAMAAGNSSAKESDVVPISTADNGVESTKTAYLSDDGSYTIQIDAFATGEVRTETEPTDIVMVLDVSGSMDEEDFPTGTNFVACRDYVRDAYKKHLYHLCSDGTYSDDITWTTKNQIVTTRYEFHCNHCGYTQGVDSFGGLDKVGEEWGLYEEKNTTVSRLDAMKEAANRFIEETADVNQTINNANDKHRISIVSFASDADTETGLTVVDDNGKATLENAVNGLRANGATAVDDGLKEANSVLNSSSNDRNKVVILFSDGSPTNNNGFENDVAADAVSEAYTLKNTDKATIYSISVLDGADPSSDPTQLGSDVTDKTNKFMHAVSSNYPQATATGNGNSFNVDWGEGNYKSGYYKTATNVSDLDKIFEDIGQDVGGTEVELDENAVLKDIIPAGFDVSNATATAQTFKYTGLQNGERTWATEPEETLNASITDNTISVKGFDYAGNCVIDQSGSVQTQGEKLVLTITGIEATDDLIGTGDSDGKIFTNDKASGIYVNDQSTEKVESFEEPTVLAPTEKSYVMDYAKPMTVSTTDWSASSISSLDSEGMHQFSNAQSNLSESYGNVVADSNKNQLTYTPKTMKWDNYDSFYSFGKAADNQTNLWSKVNVIPANNVYYEDDFVTDTKSGTVGIEYTGNWENVTDATPDQGDKNAVTGDQNQGETVTDNHGGWQEGSPLADDLNYSDGTAHLLKDGATATFTFTGSGVDVYSRTNIGTGIVVAELYNGNSTEAPALSQFLVVNNKADSGDYYQIPTVSFSGLDVGTYTVKLTVASGENSKYFIDGIRVYNPLTVDQEEDQTVSEAYGTEKGASFTTVRDTILDQSGLTTEEDGSISFPEEPMSNTLFLDKNENGQTGTSTTDVGTYFDYGPKNEVYLAQGQSVAFSVDGDGQVAVGMKSPTGNEINVEATQGNSKTNITVNHSTDLYYEITPNDDGQIVITNTSESLLSITKIKTTYGEKLSSYKIADMIAYANTMNALPVVDYTGTPSDDENQTEVEEPSQPEKPEQGDVDIQNPDQNDDTTVDNNSSSSSWLEQLLGGIFGLLGF